MAKQGKNMQRGQGVSEYLIFIFIGLIICGVIYLMSDLSFSGIVTAINRSMQPQTSNPASQPQGETIEIVGVTVDSQNIDRVIDTVSLEVPNCTGSGEVTMTRTISRTVAREVQFGVETGSGFPLGPVIQQIEGQLGFSSSEEITESAEISLKANPGSTMVYAVDWIGVSSSGNVEIKNGDTTEEVPFTVANSLNFQIRELEPIPCE